MAQETSHTVSYPHPSDTRSYQLKPVPVTCTPRAPALFPSSKAMQGTKSRRYQPFVLMQLMALSKSGNMLLTSATWVIQKRRERQWFCITTPMNFASGTWGTWGSRASSLEFFGGSPAAPTTVTKTATKMTTKNRTTRMRNGNMTMTQDDWWRSMTFYICWFDEILPNDSILHIPWYSIILQHIFHHVPSYIFLEKRCRSPPKVHSTVPTINTAQRRGCVTLQMGGVYYANNSKQTFGAKSSCSVPAGMSVW